jgi:NADPH-dependent 2,4-dienoyl-CoA reductase/sulfur reductase-like enzyme
MRTGHRIVIAGAGLAAASAAERLREHGYTGELVIVGDEPHRPYNRTPLSKGLLTGEVSRRDLPLRTHSGAGLDAGWRLGTPILGLDLDQRHLVLPGGEHLGFDGLIIATGVEARHLPDAPVHLPHVRMLRTLADADEIDRALARADHVAIVGGGFIGCEIAVTARARGLHATIVDLTPTLLARSLGPALGAIVGDIHRDAGVRLHLGVGVHGWTETPAGVALALDDGETITADAAVVGIGTYPRTDWLRGSGLDLTDGVLCTPTCHVRDADGTTVESVVAAGDIARWPNTRFDSTPRRIEHWINAIEMGQAAAEALLAGPNAARPFTPIPRFWSHQHGVRIQSVGMPVLGTDMVILDGTPESRRFVAGFTRPAPKGPILVGAVAFDSPRALHDVRDRIGAPLIAA